MKILPLLLLATLPAPVQQAIESAVALPEARVAIERLEADCRVERAEVKGAVERSGRVALRLFGAGCPAWTWAEVRLFAPALVVARDAREGEAIEVRQEEREVRAGSRPIAALPPGAVADRPLRAGTVLEARHLRSPGPVAGDAVRVVLQTGALRLEQPGRIVDCNGPRVCAVLPGGKRVEGRLAGESLLVEM